MIVLAAVAAPAAVIVFAAVAIAVIVVVVVAPFVAVSFKITQLPHKHVTSC